MVLTVAKILREVSIQQINLFSIEKNLSIEENVDIVVLVGVKLIIVRVYSDFEDENPKEDVNKIREEDLLDKVKVNVQNTVNINFIKIGFIVFKNIFHFYFRFYVLHQNDVFHVKKVKNDIDI